MIRKPIEEHLGQAWRRKFRRARKKNPDSCFDAVDTLKKVKYLAKKNGYKNITELSKGIMSTRGLYHGLRFGGISEKYIVQLELRLTAKRETFLFWLSGAYIIDPNASPTNPNTRDAIDILRSKD